MEINFLEENRFTEKPMEENPQEEAFASDWEVLLNNHTGVAWELLRYMFVELSFPVASGQSNNPEFLAALKRGVLPINKEAWVPSCPNGFKVYLHSTLAGRLPVIECEAEQDFVHLHQSLVCRNEPCHVPDSRGATIVKNYNNWARVNMHKSPEGGIPKYPNLYRDYIALLSYRNYSGIPAQAFGLTSIEWKQKSLILRREHEAAHYMTQRFYHCAKNSLHDEIIADFMGLTAAFEEYEPDKFLTFLGLEGYPAYRQGGRLEIYLPTNSEGFVEACKAVNQAAKNIAHYYKKTGNNRLKMFHTLCRTSVADMERGNFA